MSDPIADLIIRIKNSQAVNKKQVTVPFSKFKNSIVSVMKENGYVDDIKIIKDETHKISNLHITLSDKKISHIKIISKPGQRTYTKGNDIPRPLRGFGLLIVTTSQGVISGYEARKKNIGGELICEVW